MQENTSKELISIVVPVFNESLNLPSFYNSLIDELSKLNEYGWDILFVNDGSLDNSFQIISLLAKKDIRIKAIDLSRNFGKEVALSAGLHEASKNSAAVICLDADLQHPTKLIPKLIQAWKSGAEMVITIRVSSENESLFRKLSSDFYYWFINKISDVKITPKSTDFRLYDKKVVQNFLLITERNRMFRGVMDWMGFKKVYIPFHADGRAFGKTTFSVKRLLALAINSVLAFSLWPLRLTGYLGFIITLTSFIALVFMTFNYFTGNSFSLSTLAFAIVANTLLIGIVLMSIGLIALYVGTIHVEVTNRPLYLIRDKINF